MLTLLRPFLVPILVAVFGLAGIGIQTWRLHSAQLEIAETGRLLDAAVHVRDEALAANSGLVQRIATQNQAIASLATQGQVKEKAAQKASQAVLMRPAPKIEGHGPDVMNRFVRELFGD